MISCSADGTLKVWNTNKMNLLSNIRVDFNPTCLAWSSDYTSFIVGSESACYFYNVETSTLISKFSHEWNVDSLLVDSIQNTFYVGSATGSVSIFDIKSGKLSDSFIAHSDSVTSLVRIDRQIVTTSHDCRVKWWEGSTCLQEYESGHLQQEDKNGIWSIDYSSGYLVSGGSDSVIKIYE